MMTISSEFDGELIEATNRRGNVKIKPNQIVQYNKYMSGTGRQDQMMAYYPCERKTLRWYKKIGIHFVQICMLNSYLLYTKNIKKISYYDYRLSVINSLLSWKTINIPSQVSIPTTSEHFPKKVEKNEKKRPIRKRYRQCANGGIRTETTYFCPLCDGEPCFLNYHKNP